MSKNNTLLRTFKVNASNIQLLKSPNEFKQKIFSQLILTKRRCSIATLYIGAEQDELYNQIIELSNRGIDVCIVTDYCRSNRPEFIEAANRKLSSMDILYKHCKDRISPLFNWYLCETPLRRAWHRLFPYRLQETIGVFHWKMYIFDDNILITGANLSETYLSNRYDRWIYIEGEKNLCDYLVSIINIFSTACYKFDYELYTNFAKPKNTMSVAFAKLEMFISNYRHKETDTIDLTDSALITYGIQFGQSELLQFRRTQSNLIQDIFRNAYDSKCQVYLSSPYLNMSQNLFTFLSNNPIKGMINIIGASPAVMSFINDGFFSSAIPYAYTALIANLIKKLAKVIRVNYYEFFQTGSTFHAKGIWCIIDETRISTLTGSTNFNVRSSERDFECLFLIETQNKLLYKQFEEEINSLREKSIYIQNISSINQKTKNAKWITRVLASILYYSPTLRSML